MNRRLAKSVCRRVGTSCVFVVVPVWCAAQEMTLTLNQALDMARTRAPVVLSARARIEEARGRLKGASVLLQQNPSIETEVGPRISTLRRFTDIDVAVTQE